MLSLREATMEKGALKARSSFLTVYRSNDYTASVSLPAKGTYYQLVHMTADGILIDGVNERLVQSLLLDGRHVKAVHIIPD